MTNTEILTRKFVDQLPTFHKGITVASFTLELYSFKKRYDDSLYRCTGILVRLSGHVKSFEKFMLVWHE